MGKCVRTSISIDKKSTIKNERPFDPGHEREIDCIVVLRSNVRERTQDRAVFFHRENFRETKIYVISA